MLFVVMPSTEQELESFFMSVDPRPREGGVTLVIRIWITHTGTLDEALHKEEIVFWVRQTLRWVGRRPGADTRL